MRRLSEWLLAAVLCLTLPGLVTAGQDENGRDADPAPALAADIALLQTEWARVRYHVHDDDAKIEEYARLAEVAAGAGKRWPDHAEPKIWEAIILASSAGVSNGLSALRKVKRARTLLEAALEIDETALDGSAHTSLGSLYYQVPGWPLAFGDDDLAEQHLRAALAINPDGIDPNYFYGDYLLHMKRYDQAVEVFKHALEALPRPGRELADAGRRQEIRAALAGLHRR